MLKEAKAQVLATLSKLSVSNILKVKEANEKTELLERKCADLLANNDKITVEILMAEINLRTV